MSRQRLGSRIARRSALSMLLMAGMGLSAHAANGTWNVNADGAWGTASNWASNAIADGANFTANFTFNITATRTVNLNSNRTIGNLVFTDSTTSSNNLIIGGTLTNTLTLQNVTTPVIDVTQSGRVFEIQTILGGTGGFNKIGPGQLNLTNNNNTYTGATTILDGILQIRANNALGASTTDVLVNNTGSPTAADNNNLELSGGVTLTRNVILQNTGTTGFARTNFLSANTLNGNANTMNGNITFSGVQGGQAIQAGSANLTINGNITNDTVAPAPGLTLRGGSAGTIGAASVITFPGVQISKTDGGTWTFNNTTTALHTNLNIQDGFIVIGANQALSSGQIILGQGSSTTGRLTVNSGITQDFTGIDSIVGSSAGPHLLNGPGNLNTGATSRILNISDRTAAVDEVSATVNFSGTGGIEKTNSGVLVMTNNTVSGPTLLSGGTMRVVGANFAGGLTSNTGTTLTIGTDVTGTTLTAASLNFGAGTTTLNYNLGTLGDSITNPGTLTQAGTTTINFGSAALGSFLTPSTTYPIIPYTGTSPGVSGFVIGTPVPQRAVASIVDTGTAIALQVNSIDKVIWTGSIDPLWDINTTQNWKLQSNDSPTGFVQGDDLIFNDSGMNAASIALNVPVSPSRLDFQNTTAVPYVITGTGSLTGAGQIVKSGNGTTTFDLSGTSTLAGATTVNAGTLEIKSANTSYVTAVQNADPLFNDNLNVATGATLRLSSNNVAFNVARDVVGAGTVELDSTAGGTAASLNVTISGNNTGFTGLWKLTASGSVPGNGTFRTANATAQANLGSAAIDVDNGAQLWYTGALNNNITITGSGYQEVAGGVPVAGVIAEGLPSYSGIGAIRMTGGALSGNITLDGTAKITSWNASTTISGNITNTNSTDTLVVAGSGNVGANQTQTLILTGNNLGLEKIWINSGTQQTGAFTNSTLLQIGNGGTTGTLGSGNVIMHSDTPTAGTIQTILDIRRSDGYTLAANQSILADSTSGSSFGNNVLFINTTGTGFVLGSTNSIDLTDAAGLMATPTAGGVVRVGSAANNSLLDLQTGSLLRAGNLHVGEAANFAGVVNQAAGSTVELVNQFRVGHFSTQTSTYNMNGGTFSMIGSSPATTPSTTGATEQNGGMYVGVDGRGIFNQNNGTVTTNFVVLDNRGTTDTNANITGGGIDQYNLSGGTLNVRSTWGIIQRQNNTAEFNLSGGTIRVDDTGTGTGTGPNIVVPIDATMNVTGTASILDTNAGTFTGNGFAIRRSLLGGGTVTTQGGGNVTLNPVGSESGLVVQMVSATIAGNSPIIKDGANTVTIFQAPQTYSGTTAVNGGVLLINNTLASPLVTIADGAAVGGEQSINALTVGSSSGGTVFFNPTTPGAMTVGTFTATGTTLVDFSAVPVGTGPFTVLNYTTNTTPGATYNLANAATYRGTPTVTDSGAGPGAVTLTGLTTKNLTWTGSVNNTWDAGATANTNWTDGSANNFYSYDSVTFNDTAPPTATTITATGVIQPSSITVNSNTNNYTINGVISGPGSLTKSGTSTLTLGGTNAFFGPVTINGGTVSISSTYNLGVGMPGNNITLNGGTLQTVIGTDNTTLNLGVNRILTAGASGGTLSSTPGTGRITAISGPLAGSGSLSFTGGGNFDLRGDNSGFNGPVNINSTVGGGGTTLTLSSPLSNTTVTIEPGTVTANAANTFQFHGISLPVSTNIIAKAFNDGTNGFRSSITSNAAGGAVNGTIQLEATASSALQQLVQFNAGGNSTVSSLDINGPVSATMAGFNGIMFIRGTGLGRINNTVNLPNGVVSKTDAGTWEINSTGNTWTSTNVLVGTVRTTVANALPATAGIIMGQNDANTAVLDLNGFNATASSLTSNPTTTGANTTGKSITSATPATLTINQATNTTYASVLTGALSFVKSDVGTLTLTGTNTYTGTTTVSGGTLSLGSGAARGTSTINVGPGATAEINGTNLFVTGHGIALDNSRVITVDGGTLLATTNANTRIGNVTLTNGATWTSDRGFAAFDLLLADTSTGAATVTVSGTGAATMNGAGGIHMLGVQNFNVADTVAGSASDLNVSMILANSGSQGANSPGGFNKLGAGTMTLSGANTYTGATNVTAGTLRINGDNSAATGAVTVSALATLGGSGTVGGLTTVASTGIVAPGNSAGNLTFGAGADLSAGGVYSWELGALSTSSPGVNFDAITVSGGNLALGGSSALTLDFGLVGANGPNSADSFWSSNQTWKIIDVTGGTNTGSTNLSSITNATYSSGSFTTTVGSGADAGDIFLVFTTNTVGGTSIWQGANNDNWTAAGSWNGSVPNSAAAEAKFETTGGTTANLNANQTVNKLTFDSTAVHTISGASTLTLAGTTPVISTAGSNTATQTVAVNLDLAAGTAINVQGGTLELNSPANAVLGTGVTATVANGATLSLGGAGNALSNGGSTHANVANSGTLLATTPGKRVGNIDGTGTTTVNAANATLTANHVRQATLNIGAGNTVTIANNGTDTGTSVVTSLNINATGKLDLNDNDLVVKNGNLTTLTAQLATGLDINGNYGGGPGITSTAFANNMDFNTVLGIAANSDLGYTSFSGQTVGNNDVLIKYTYYGDADLSGSVDTSTDFDLYITGLTSGGSLGGWLFGDFDYSGTVDSSTDFDLYITGLTSQGSPLLSAGGGGNLVQAVPEPSTFVLGGLALLGFAGVGIRRRRLAKQA